MEAKSKICRVDHQAGEPERDNSIASSSLKTVCWQNSLLLRGGQSFVLFRISTDWMRPTHIMEGNLL